MVDNSVWFTLVGPESGFISIDALGFDNQIALYEASSAADLISGDESRYSLIAANDDFHGEEDDYAAKILYAQVESGQTYWLQVDGSACGASGHFSLTLTDDKLTSIQDREENLVSALSLHPNPASDRIILDWPDEGSGSVISITAADGRLVLQTTAQV